MGKKPVKKPKQNVKANILTPPINRRLTSYPLEKDKAKPNNETAPNDKSHVEELQKNIMNSCDEPGQNGSEYH